MLLWHSTPAYIQESRELTAAGLKFITTNMFNNRYATFLLPYSKCLTNIIASVLLSSHHNFSGRENSARNTFLWFSQKKVIKNIKSFVCFRISTQNFSISRKFSPSKAPLIKEHVIFKSHATPFPVCAARLRSLARRKAKEVKSMPSHRRMCVFVITY